MESNSPNNKYAKTAITVLITAVIQSIIFCLIIGLPLPQFFSSRDVESLQFQQLPEQKRTQPIEALENPTPAPAPTVAPVAHEPMKRKPRPAKHEAQDTAQTKPEPQLQQPAETQTKVVVVNFEKSKAEDKAEDKKQEVVEQKAQPIEEKPELIPVKEKLAGVQAEKDDAKTEATAATAEVPKDDPATTESTEKAEPAN